MAVIGLILVLTGFIMNIKVLRGPYRGKLTPAEIMHTGPWLMSVSLIALGIVAVVAAAQH